MGGGRRINGGLSMSGLDSALDTHVHQMHLEGVIEHLHDVDDMRRLSDEFMRVMRAQKAIWCISL